MNINFSSMMNNSLSQSNQTHLKVLKTQAENSLANNQNISYKNKVTVEGRIIQRPDHQRNNKKLMEVCKDFESIFVNQVFKAMRSTVNNKNNILHGGYAEEVFSDMLYENYSKLVSQKSDFGFGKMLYDHLTTIKRGY